MDYFSAVNSARNHKKLYQYTTIEALECIVKNKSLLLRRIDKLNDTVENERNSDLWKYKIYTACFTHRECESLFFWKTYAGKDFKGNSEGIMISFEANSLIYLSIHPDEKCEEPALVISEQKDYNVPFSPVVNSDSWVIYNYAWVDICYISRDIDDYEIPHFLGRFKYKEWDMECETRLRVAIRPLGEHIKKEKMNFLYLNPNNEQIYAKLSRLCLENMTITLSPFANENLATRVEDLLKKNGLYGKVKVKPSILTNELY